MRRTSLTAVLLGLMALGLSLHAEDKKEPAKDEEGFISLFNGKDLTGWKANENGEWKVEDGAIITPPQRSHLYHEKEFKNFDFRAEVLTTPGSNSGIYFRTKYEDEGFPSVGVESQVNTTHTDTIRNGSLYYLFKNPDPIVKDNEWFDYRIVVKGKHVQNWINGKQVADYTEPETGEVKRRIPEKGVFAFQGHDPKSVVKYRNIRVKELPDE